MQERNLKFSTSIKGNRYLELKEKRQELAAYYIKQGKMADPERKYSLGSAPALVGECMDMCPLFERHEREFQTGGLDKSEKIPGTENVDHQRAVKRYRRSAAGDPPPLPCDVRPPHVLMVWSSSLKVENIRLFVGRDFGEEWFIRFILFCKGSCKSYSE